jgi:transposase
MRYIQVKSVQQQDIQAVHRIRSELMNHRKAKANQLRGLVAEYGLVAPKQYARLRAAVPDWLEHEENGLTDLFRRLLHGLWKDLTRLDKRITEMDQEIERLAKDDPMAERLQQLRGIGPLTAMLATIGDGKQYKHGRQMSASLGLTPRQYSSGGKERLLGISKRGDAYLRTLLIHGARSVILHAKHKDDDLSRWVKNLGARRHIKVVAVALANKTARMGWAMMTKEVDYDPEMASA